jgi:hypothetical protein
MTGAATLVWLLCASNSAHAQLGVGTWVRQVGPSTPGQVTMIVETCCGGGRRLTYKLGDLGQTMVIESAFDGREVPVLVNGKPSGETMAITLVDALHTVTVVKMNGKQFGVSKGSLSADGKTLTVSNDYSASVGGGPVGMYTEVWRRR